MSSLRTHDILSMVARINLLIPHESLHARELDLASVRAQEVGLAFSGMGQVDDLSLLHISRTLDVIVDALGQISGHTLASLLAERKRCGAGGGNWRVTLTRADIVLGAVLLVGIESNFHLGTL